MIIKQINFGGNTLLNFYSQTGEDLFVYLNLINQERKDGVYLELGAWDGLVYSNTKFFQDQLSFNGVLIEPIPSTYLRLVQNRPKDFCVNAAVAQEEGTAVFLGNEPTAGISKTISDHMRSANHKNSHQYTVTTEPLSNILNRAEVDYLDMFFLDVEGGEYEVLKSMNWEIPVYIVCIELDGTNEEKDKRCRDLLEDQGFFMMKRLCSNEFWVNSNYPRKELLYEKQENNFQFINHFLEPQHAAEVLFTCYGN